jgi:hypothetical protein
MSSRMITMAFLLATLWSPTVVEAQTTTATVQGTITDSTGAALANAVVVITGETVSRSVQSDERGFYRVPALPAGKYALTASREGFLPTDVDDLTLTIDRTVTVDLRLNLSGLSTAVTVTARSSSADTTTSSTADYIDAATIDSIPLNGRNYLDLVQLVPGVTVNSTVRSDLPTPDTRGSIFGERAGNAAFFIDGFDNNDDVNGGVLQRFTQDAIQEFEVIQAGYKAEFGRGSGGVVNVLTKSGANRPVGSGFLFVRNDALDSSNVPNAQPPELSRYNGGGTFGGPIVRDRAWFFGSIEHVAEKREAIFPENIPSLLLASEDFSRKPRTTTSSAFGKYTQRLNPRHDLRAEISWTRAALDNERASAIALPSASTNRSANTVFANVAVASVISPRLIVDSSFGIRSQQSDQNQDAASTASSSVRFVEDGTEYEFGPPLGSVQRLTQRYYTGREVVTAFLDDRHTTKAGIEMTHTTADGASGPALVNFILTTRDQFAAFGPASFQIPQGVGFATA